MKLTTTVWSLSTVAGALAASAGHVFLLDPSTSTSHPAPHHDTVSPSTAQLIFAQRLGISSSYDLPADADDKTLSQLNAFAGHPSTLLRGNRHQEDPARLLIFVDDVDSPIDLLPTAEGAAFFDLSPAPHHEQTEALLKEFEHHASQAAGERNAYIPDAIRQIEGLDDSNRLSSFGSRSILRIRSVKTSVNAYGRSSKEYKEHLISLRSLLQDIISTPEAISGGLTIIMTPPESLSAKRSDKTYNLTPRAASAVRIPSEAPLQDAVSRIVSESDNSPMSSPAESINILASSDIKRGPIPAYYASKSACEKTTNNCTGHGECVLQFKQKDEDGKDKDVFGCSCKPQITKLKSGGQQTTRYGGGACNKVDISAPFWLLAGTTIFFLFLISWGVGLLYSMGEADLPSVIGAGVSGPRATK